MPDLRSLRWLVPLAAVLLAACGTAPHTQPVRDRSADDMAAASTGPKEGTWFGDQAARKVAQTSGTGDSLAQPVANGPALPRPDGPQVAALPEPDRLPGPEDLTGLDGLQIQALLGLPDFRRRDPPAELWQYAGPGCILDAFLYAEDGGALRVKHVEARSHSVTRVPLADCYRGILAERRKPQGG